MKQFSEEPLNTFSHNETAVAILVWLAGEPDLLNRFCGLTGIQADQLRKFCDSPGFERAMIGFIAGHEPTLVAFCRKNNVAPETISRLWQKLEQGDQEISY